MVHSVEKYLVLSQQVSEKKITNWSGLLFLLLVCKMLLYWVDPHPMFFMGDSGVYLETALTGWIPPARSFLYGYLIMPLVKAFSSLMPVVLMQVIAGAVIALLIAIILNHYLKVNKYLRDNFDAFSKYIKERYTSCDGFISYYSNDATEWADWSEDSHKCGSVLQFICDNEGIEEPYMFDDLHISMFYTNEIDKYYENN